MIFLPKSTILGRLEFLEVYEEYDGPRLFSCRNTSGQIYLAIWVEQLPDLDIWLYVPVSRQRFDYIRSGGIDLRDALLAAEDGLVFIAKISRLEEKASIEMKTSSKLEDRWLPEPEQYLELATITLPSIKNEIEQIALSKRRDIIHLRLDVPYLTRCEAPARALGNYLRLIQDTIDAIGNVLESRDIARGPLPQAQIAKTELVVTRTFHGSFGVELSSAQPADLFGDTTGWKAIEYFISLLNSGSNVEELKQKFHELKIRPTSKYREFLTNVLRTNIGFNLKWASPIEGRGGMAELLVRTAQEAIIIINEIDREEPFEYDITGTLVGANTRTKVYEIRGSEENRKISGKILDEALPQVEFATLNREYIARIREIPEVNPTTGETNYKKQLVSLIAL
jgi:hypothetical protein